MRFKPELQACNAVPQFANELPCHVLDNESHFSLTCPMIPPALVFTVSSLVEQQLEVDSHA